MIFQRKNKPTFSSALPEPCPVRFLLRSILGLSSHPQNDDDQVMTASFLEPSPPATVERGEREAIVLSPVRSSFPSASGGSWPSDVCGNGSSPPGGVD